MSAAGPLALASLPVLTALIDEARKRDYRHGVLGVRARPEWPFPACFPHGLDTVRVVPCSSTLAVREALTERPDDGWLIVLTDRDDGDLGAGVLTHLVWHRLRTPDPWEAVKQAFQATGLDPALITASGHRELAAGLLALTPTDGWPVARGGVLTKDHALASVARTQLLLGDPDVDEISLLTWTTTPDAVARIGELRHRAGDTLTDAVLEWTVRRLGVAAPAVLRLLRAGRAGDCVPMGLVVGAVRAGLDGDAADVARDAFIRLESALDRGPVAHEAARVWGRAAASVVATWEHDPRPRAAAVLARADQLLAGLGGQQLAGGSDLLPSGLGRRLEGLADAIVRGDGPTEVERAWEAVEAHTLASADARVPRFHAAVRLLRWLARDETPAGSFSQLVARHGQQDAWVDAAVSDAFPGVGEATLGRALEQVLNAVRERRDEHDQVFADALVRHTADDLTGEVLHLEDLLVSRVLPLAAQVPVLFLLLDGMSVSVATEVVADVLRAPGWRELSWDGRRGSAVAVLPTLTEVSRASLFCGQLLRGDQTRERSGVAALAATAGVGAVLFHKKPVETSRPGHAIADDVGAAIDDVQGKRLVACVLNTIDDALDRSDPDGIEWGAETVRHLGPLLERAQQAGRIVVLTADHGHVVERRQGTKRTYPQTESGRSRSADPGPAQGEVLVRGRRVVTTDRAAVLAVDERVRFGPLKAGYHGGASPAEVVVPLVALVPDGASPPGLVPLQEPVEPSWWPGPVLDASPVLPVAAASAPAKHGTLSMFDEPATQDPLVQQVLASENYQAQTALAPRRVVQDQAVEAVLAAFLATPARRLPRREVVHLLGVAPAQARGALSQLQQLLNVDSYEVVGVDGETVLLDEALLRQQFDVS